MQFFGNFSNKFAPKKAPVRKNLNGVETTEDLDELVTGQRLIQLRLGDQDIVFENGEWIPESGKSGTAHRTSQKMRKKMQALQEENNLLRLKCSILLNMLTQATAETQIQVEELKKLGKTK